MDEPKTAQQHNAQLTGQMEFTESSRIFDSTSIRQRREQLDKKLSRLITDPILRQAVITVVME